MFSMSCSRNEVVLVPIPFTDLSSRKVRPAVVLGSTPHGDLLLAPITSQAHNIDSPLQHWSAAGLNVACGVKAQLATVDQRCVLKTVGSLSATDVASLNSSLRRWLNL
jgi:mRNA interferase MazF